MGSWVAFADAPATLSHQGVIAVRGERFTGIGAFRFAIINLTDGGFLWVNDGSEVAAPEAPTSAVSLPVVNGVYQVQRGDESLPNMTELPPNLFLQHQGVALRVWFDDMTGGGVHALTPDVPLTTVPYAHYSDAATQLNIPGTGTFAVRPDPSGNVSVIGGMLVGNTRIVEANLQRVAIGNSTPAAKLDVQGSMRVDVETLVVGPNNNRVGIGTVAPAATLDVIGTTRSTTMQITNASGAGLAPPGTVVAFAGASPPTGWLLCNGATVDRAGFADLFAAIGT